MPHMLANPQAVLRRVPPRTVLNNGNANPFDLNWFLPLNEASCLNRYMIDLTLFDRNDKGSWPPELDLEGYATNKLKENIHPFIDASVVQQKTLGRK